MTVLFAHEAPRPIQDTLLAVIDGALRNRTHLLVHAPTGLGKTAAALGPALAYALEHDLTVFFLTARHTQHHIALETAHKIKERHGVKFGVTSIIGKQHMCAQEGIAALSSSVFHEHCRHLREDGRCEFYLNAHAKPDTAVQHALNGLLHSSPMPAENVLARCAESRLCPYELSLMMAHKSALIIADYYYVFHPRIRETFFAKIHKDIARSIIIVDEAHNLPQRARDLLTSHLSARMLRNALKEARDRKLPELAQRVQGLQDALASLSQAQFSDDARIVSKDEWIEHASRVAPYERIIVELNTAADGAKEDVRASALSGIAAFLESWRSSGEGFVRILDGPKENSALSLRCLDPSLATRGVIEQSYMTLMMSGTLLPTQMFRDLLGFSSATPCESLPSPFPRSNRLTLVVPKTTTKYSQRSSEQFREIAGILSGIAEETPGCLAFFFPSYKLRDAVFAHFSCRKPCLLEQPGMSKEEKANMLKRLRASQITGAVLLAVAAGNFGEGVDLPGVLQGVVIIGLPLNRPDIETKERIEYYNRKFGKGWDYGYILPAINKVLQNAGRCIRSAHDRGVIIFLDERYAWPRYLNCIPADWQAKVTSDYRSQIRAFL